MSSIAQAAGSAAAIACSAGGRASGDGFCGRERQDRAQPLSAGIEAVSHRPVQSRRAVRRRGDEIARGPRRSARAGCRDIPTAARRALLPLVVLREDGAGRAQVAALVQNLDALFGLFQPRVAKTRELDAALVQLERFLERQVSLFELLDDGLELGDRRFEVLNGRCPYVLMTLQSNSPSDSVTRTVSPGFDFRGFADHTRSGFIPDDRIPAAQHGERAQAVEPRSARVEAGLRAMMAVGHRCAQAAVDSDQPCSHAAKPALEIELLELQAKRLVRPQPTGDGTPAPRGGARGWFRRNAVRASARRADQPAKPGRRFS